MFVDGRPLHDVPEGEHGGVEVLYARRAGANAADDRIVEYVRAHDDPSTLEVITSDRVLSSRAKAAGAEVHGAGWLLERLDEVANADG